MAVRSMKVMRRGASIGRGCARSVRAAAAPVTANSRKTSPLEKGGTLKGDQAFGKDAAKATLEGSTGGVRAVWSDSRWVDGTWDKAQFQKADGETDWDAMIDAEAVRRRALEKNPAISTDDDPVNFDTSDIPWWAWVRRFHLPEAELVNGRAAMVGYFLGYMVDLASGHGLVDQSSGFLGKTLIFATVVGVCMVRNVSDLDNLKGLLDEATFYDKQWEATWEDSERPTETET